MNSALDRTDLKPCYRRQGNGSSNLVKYLDDVMDADRMPVPDNSIFFYITTCFESGQIELKPRSEFKICLLTTTSKIQIPTVEKRVPSKVPPSTIPTVTFSYCSSHRLVSQHKYQNPLNPF